MKFKAGFYQLVTFLRLMTLLGTAGWIYFHPNVGSMLPFLFLLGAFFMYSAVISLLQHIGRIAEGQATKALLYLDMLFITLLVAFTGGWDSPFYLAYFLLVALHAFSGGLTMGLNVALGSSILYLATNFTHLPGIYWGDMMMRLAFLYLVAVALSLVARELNKKSVALERKLAQITSLYRVSQNMTNSGSRKELLEKVIDDVMEISGANSAVIFMAAQEQLHKAASRGLMFSGEINVPGELRPWVLEKGEPLLLSDIREEAMGFELSLQWGVKSLLAVPMKVHDEVIGMFILTSKTRQAFSLDILDLLITIASETAVALEHKRLYGEMTRKIGELSTLAEVSRSIVSTLNLDEILQLVVKLAKQMMGAEACSCYLWEGEDRLVLRTQYGDPQAAGRVNLPPAWAGKIQESEMLVLAGAEERYLTRLFREGNAASENHGASGSGTGIMVPLLSKGNALGVIIVYLPGEITGSEQLVPLHTLTQQAAAAIENAILYRDTRAMFVDTIQALVAAIDAKDTYTRGHSERVMRYAKAIAAEMGVSTEEEEIIAHAALLHDIGKIGIHENILQKPNILTEGEYDALKDHPRIGAHILSHISTLKEIVPIIYHHHERFDGQGYHGLKKMPLGARIVAVADSFEAMTSDRPYRKAMAVREAREELKREAGTQFDPDVVQAFLKVLDKWEKNRDAAIGF